jgi:hypothetical protein
VAANGTIGVLSFAAAGVDVASVLVGGALSFGGTLTMTVRVEVLVRPLWSVTT